MEAHSVVRIVAAEEHDAADCEAQGGDKAKAFGSHDADAGGKHQRDIDSARNSAQSPSP